MPPSSSDSTKSVVANIRLQGFLFLAITSIGWAMNWPAIKFLLREWPPLFSRGVSGVAAAVLLGAIAFGRGERLAVPRAIWPALSFAAFTNVFAWMGFGTMSMQHLNIAEAALLGYTMPLWTMLFAWPVLGNRPSPRGVIGLLLAMLGLAVLFSGSSFTFGPEKWAGIAYALIAATLFALGSVMAKGPLPIAPIATVAWQVGLGCLPMVIIGWFVERPQLSALSAVGLADLIYMAIGPMGLCYLSWFAALKRLPAATAATGTLTVPIMGIIAGAIVLGEPLGWPHVIACVLTLAGVALSLRQDKPQPEPAA